MGQTNFTIHRDLINSDDYGCTEFQTNQTAGDQAGLGSTGPIDGDIVWFLDADPGYIVDIADFSIPNAVPTTATQTPTYKTFWHNHDGNCSLYPYVNGVVFETITSTRIKITIFLCPSTVHGITGSVFVMPNSDLSFGIAIDGCSRLATQNETIEIFEG